MFRLLCTSALLLVLSVAGCAKGRGVVLVHVNDANPSAPISGIDRFLVTVTDNGGKSGGPYTVGLLKKPATLPPEQTFSLSFGASVSGPITVSVQAIGTDGATVASGSNTATEMPSHVVEATVTLTAGAVLPGLVALRTSAISTVGPNPGTDMLKLYEDGFEFGERACAGALCVTGGLSP
jgi:hypothetical protein